MFVSTVLAYASAFWPPQGRGWPVSFFVAALVILPVVAVSLLTRGKGQSSRVQLAEGGKGQ